MKNVAMAQGEQQLRGARHNNMAFDYANVCASSMCMLCVCGLRVCVCVCVSLDLLNLHKL